MGERHLATTSEINTCKERERRSSKKLIFVSVHQKQKAGRSRCCEENLDQHTISLLIVGAQEASRSVQSEAWNAFRLRALTKKKKRIMWRLSVQPWLAGRLTGLPVLESSMAGEPWNRVNIPYPGAVSTVRANFNAKTGTFPSHAAINRLIWTLPGCNVDVEALFMFCAAHAGLGCWLNVLIWVFVVVPTAQMSSSKTCLGKTRRYSSCTRVRFFRRRSGSCTSWCMSWTTATGTTRRSKRCSRSVVLPPECCFNNKNISLRGYSVQWKNPVFLLSGWTMHKQAEDDEAESCSNGPEGSLSC